MGWISLALFSAALFGVVTALEKRLIDRHLPNLSVYYASIAYSLLIPAVLVFFATGGVADGATNLNMGWAALSGGTWGVDLDGGTLRFWRTVAGRDPLVWIPGGLGTTTVMKVTNLLFGSMDWIFH